MLSMLYRFKDLQVLTAGSWDELQRLAARLSARRREEEHERLVKLLASRGIADARVLGAMRQVERHHFVPAALLKQAYRDRPLPIGLEQTISQPYMVALMTQLLALQGGERVLEVGTGSGYQTAILVRLCQQVYSLELREELAQRARSQLDRLAIKNVAYRCGDGWQGWPEQAPFDRILVAAAAPHMPSKLVEQMAPGGIMVVPIGTEQQTLLEVRKAADGSLRQIDHGPVLFVPLVEPS
ncbi:MAG: protein-L-isoaspartate(D-aspartate) O-methyltransferase [Candidatus Xenobia bacterium]